MERGKRKELIGVVISDKMDKTRVVAIESWKVHPIYKKRYRSTRKVMAHDEDNATVIGTESGWPRRGPYRGVSGGGLVKLSRSPRPTQGVTRRDPATEQTESSR